MSKEANAISLKEAAAAVPGESLRRKTARGALFSGATQGISFTMRIGSMVILARLLTPEDFGIVAMVTAFTGFISLFRDAGLSMATVQSAEIREEQTSTLFWINLAVGAALAILTAAAAPFLAEFYHEPRLLWITLAVAVGFLFNGASAQHRAILQREMRFSILARVEVGALCATTFGGIALAAAGGGYWALVMMTVLVHVFGAFGFWLVVRWKPGPPRKFKEVQAMLHYGGIVTINSVIVYLAYNAEKVLLGRFWGAETLGLYGRAYQLSNLPTENLNATIGSVAFPALSRVQNDPPRLKSYFLRGYTLFLSLVFPITVGCAIFAADIVAVFLGRQWTTAVNIFALLAPTILAFALMNPFAWLMFATGQAVRSLKIACMIAPVVILAYVLALKRGPESVAMAYSVAMVLLVIPMITWAKKGTLIRWKDVLLAIIHPAVAITVAAGLCLLLESYFRTIPGTFIRLIVESSALFTTYAVVLLFVLGKKDLYFDIFRDAGLWRKKV